MHSEVFREKAFGKYRSVLQPFVLKFSGFLFFLEGSDRVSQG